MMNMVRVIVLLGTLVSSAVMAAEPAAPPAVKAEAAPAKPATEAGVNKPAATTSGARRSSDRIDLDTTVVTGNRELPKVLYIVPWKKADIGDMPAQPFNSLLDETLTPVDRDVFRREVTYYGAIAPDAKPAVDAASPSTTRTGGSEK